MNISQSGLAFIATGLNITFNIGDIYKSFICCGDKQVEVILLVIRINGDLIGVKVNSNMIDYSLLINHYLKLELLALESYMINSSKLQSDPDGRSFWIQSTSSCELFYVLNESDEIVKYNITIFGNIILRNKLKNFQFKEVWEEGIEESIYKGSDLMMDIETPVMINNLINHAILYTDALSSLEQEYKNTMLSELSFLLSNYDSKENKA